MFQLTGVVFKDNINLDGGISPNTGFNEAILYKRVAVFSK
jgi:hypothetical protein